MQILANTAMTGATISGTGAVEAGFIVPYAGVTAPSGYLICDGTSYLRSTYSTLFSALSVTASCTTVNGNATVTCADTSFLGVGWRVESSGLNGGGVGTITAIVNSTQFTCSVTANSTSGTFSVDILCIPWGAADTTHFYTPDLRRRTLVGGGGTGTSALDKYTGNTGGEENHTLTISEMPSHDHTGAGCRVPTTGAGTAMNLTIGGGGYNYLNNITAQGGGGSHNTIQPSAIVNYIIKT